MNDGEGNRLYVRDGKGDDGNSGVAYLEDLDKLVPFTEFNRHKMDGGGHLHLDDRERDIVRNLDRADGGDRLSFDGSRLAYMAELESHAADTAPGTIQGNLHVTDAERAFVEQYPEQNDKELLYADQVATASFEVYGKDFEPNMASMPAVQINVERYIGEGFITRRQLKGVKKVTFQANKTAGTRHVWNGKKSYLNIIVNKNPAGEEVLQSSNTDYEWLACSINSINTEDPLYCAEGVQDGKYMTWEFANTIDLSGADYIVLAFSEANRDTGGTQQIGSGTTKSRIESATASVVKTASGATCEFSESVVKNTLWIRIPTPSSTVTCGVRYKSTDSQQTGTSETAETKDPAHGTTTRTTTQTIELVNARETTRAVAVQSITTLDGTGETVGVQVTVDSTQTNTRGESITTHVVVVEGGLSGTMRTEGWTVVEPLKSQADFVTQALKCKQYRSGDKRGGFLYYLEPDEVSAHGALPGIRMVTTLYQREGTIEPVPLAKLFSLSSGENHWTEQYVGGGKNVIPLLSFNYDPPLGNIYQPRVELGQEADLTKDLGGLLEGGECHAVMSGAQAKRLYKLIYDVDYEALIGDLMDETLAAAALDGYDIGANLARWADLGARAHADKPDEYPYSAVSEFAEPVSGETVKAFRLCSLSSLQNIDMASTSSWEADLPSLTGATSGVSFPVLEQWSGKTPNLVTGSGMFAGAANLQAFTGNLSSLAYGQSMFEGCASLDRWDTALPKLVAGDGMFRSTGMEEWNANMPKLVFGRNMFAGTPLVWFTGTLPALSEGEYMFTGTSLASWTVALPSLGNGVEMFKDCKSLQTCSIPLPSLSDGTRMFSNCTSFTMGPTTLSSLLDGQGMFEHCYSMQSCAADLGNLANGDRMFFECSAFVPGPVNLDRLATGSRMFYGCRAMGSVAIDMPQLRVGNYMFAQCDGAAFTTGPTNLQSLQNGDGMYQNCAYLTTFTASLPSLDTGYGMFFGCRLDYSSVQTVFNGLRDVGDDNAIHEITVGALGLTEGPVQGCLVAEYLNETDYFYKKRVLAARRGAQDRGWVVEETYYDAVGPGARNIYPGNITEVDMEERVSDFMEETLSAASASTYDATANIEQWRTVSSKLQEYCPEDYPNTVESAPVLSTGETMNRYILCAESLSGLGTSGLKQWSSDLPSLTRSGGWHAPSSLEGWSGQMPNLVDGTGMFEGCAALDGVPESLPQLENGVNMFRDCNSAFTHGPQILPKLSDGEGMFERCVHMDTCPAELPALVNGERMFYYCSSFTSGPTLMPLLAHGVRMFEGCTSLTRVESTLPSLTEGDFMFQSCRLNKESVLRILSSLQDVRGMAGEHNITLGCLSLDHGEDEGSLVSYGTDVPYYSCDGEVSAAIEDARARGWNVSDIYRPYEANRPVEEKYIIRVGIEEQLEGLRQETAASAPLASYDLGLNVRRWKSLASLAARVFPDRYSLADETEPSFAAGETVEENLQSLESFINVSGKDGVKVWRSEVPSLVNCNSIAGAVFRHIEEWTGSMPNLQSATSMFMGSFHLAQPPAKLPNLVDGDRMFAGCSAFADGPSELPKLVNGSSMFAACRGLTSWNTRLPALVDGRNMFDGCNALTEFDASLPSIENGSNMFFDCRLSLRSVQTIIESLPTLNSAQSIGLGMLGVDSAGHEGVLDEYAGAYRRKPAYIALKQLAGEKNWNLAETFYDRVGAGAEELVPLDLS